MWVFYLPLLTLQLRTCCHACIATRWIPWWTIMMVQKTGVESVSCAYKRWNFANRNKFHCCRQMNGHCSNLNSHLDHKLLPFPIVKRLTTSMKSSEFNGGTWTLNFRKCLIKCWYSRRPKIHYHIQGIVFDYTRVLSDTNLPTLTCTQRHTN